VRSFDELTACLQDLRAWAGSLSYTEISRRIAVAREARGMPPAECRPGRVTVYSCFKTGRRRIDAELVVDIVRALGVDDAGALLWRQACRVVTGAATAAAVVNVMNALPADPLEFTGRRAELDHLTVLSASSGRATTVVAIEGMAGVGKSQLSVHAAHELLRAGHYRDAQLFVNLRGFDPHQPPADPAAVLGGFLRLLGVPGGEVEPLDLTARAARFRAALAGRNVLIVLDNAMSDEQVDPLLPTGPGCLVLVTSRRRLPRATVHVPLDVFDPAESIELLARFAGTDRIAAEPQAAARLAELCGHLPLDLSLAGSHIERKPEWMLADHVARLESIPRDESARRAVAASYHALPAAQQQLFRLLAVHPGRDITVHAAAALGGTDLATAADLLGHLLADHLLQQKETGRYEFHNLIHSYAKRMAHDEDPQSLHRLAIGRLLDHYRHTAAVAMSLVSPFDRQRDAHLVAPATPGVELATVESAAAWLEAERLNVIAAAVHAADLDLTGHTAALSAILGGYLDRVSHWRDAQILHTRALDVTDQAEQCQALVKLAAVDHRMGRFHESLGRYREALVIAGEIGDRHTAGRVLNSLGAVSERLGRHEQARDHHLEALEILREVGDRTGEAATHGNLGVVYDSLGLLDDALRHYEHAMSIFRDVGDRVNESRVLGNVGMLCERQGSYEQAESSHRRALVIVRELGDRDSEACVLSNLGVVCARLGRADEGAEQVRRALGIFDDVGDVPGQAYASTDLGKVLAAAGWFDEAVEQLDRALDLASEIEDPVLAMSVHNEIGDVLRRTGSPDQAERRYRTALALATERDDSYGVARANEGLAHLRAEAGERAAAHDHWRTALAGYTRLGVGDAERVRNLLAR
jgi:tetratricopeptide (TPR) repeat protein